MNPEQEKESYEDITDEEILACCFCKLDDCDETDPNCEYRKLKGEKHRLNVQRKYDKKKRKDPKHMETIRKTNLARYHRKKKDPVWLANYKQKRKAYLKRLKGVKK